MCDVPWVLDRYAILCLETYCAGPGNLCHPVWAFPHGRELVEAFPGEDSPEDKVPCLESVWANVAAVVAPQILLVFGRPERGTAAQPVKEEQIVVPEVLLIVLDKIPDPCGPMLDLCGEDCFSPVDEANGVSPVGLVGLVRMDQRKNNSSSIQIGRASCRERVLRLV